MLNIDLNKLLVVHLYLSDLTDITEDALDRFFGVFPTSFFSKNLSKLRTPPGPENSLSDHQNDSKQYKKLNTKQIQFFEKYQNLPASRQSAFVFVITSASSFMTLNVYATPFKRSIAISSAAESPAYITLISSKNDNYFNPISLTIIIYQTQAQTYFSSP